MLLYEEKKKYGKIISPVNVAADFEILRDLREFRENKVLL